MLKSLVAAATLLFSIPTIGYFAAGAVCFLMGIANVPGYLLWRSGTARGHELSRRFGLLVGWVGQSCVSVAFALALVLLVRLFFTTFEVWFLFRWLYWVAVFLLCLGPTYRTLSVSRSPAEDDTTIYFSFTLPFTGFTTALGFMLFAILL
jgi:hypothetical protein